VRFTLIGPVLAPAGTDVVIEVELEFVIGASIPPNLTAGIRPRPAIVTAVPTGPLVGENPVMLGQEKSRWNVNFSV
jgi:hypothetical protein